MTVKTRDCDVDTALAGRTYQMIDGFNTNYVSHFKNFRGSERCDSEDHPGWRKATHPITGFKMDRGGSFSLQRRTFRSRPGHVNLLYRYGDGRQGYGYDGEIHANVLTKVYGSSQLPNKVSSGILNIIGTKGIRNNPVKPHGSLGQFLGELHDLPKLAKLENIKTGVQFFRTLGKEYLNQQFGWKPFVRDLQAFFQNTLDADTILRQLARDNGRLVRRRMKLPVTREISQTTTKSWFTSPSLVDPLYGGIQTQHYTEIYEDLRWFSGCFRYWIPTMSRQESWWSLESNTQRNRLSRVVYGASMTPDLIWQLTPWSWLGDWFGNTGDIISNWVDIELNNLDIVYAYAMCTQRRTKTWQVTAPFYGGVTVRPQAQDIEEVMGRARSTPFGFGIDMSNISAYQASILAALGFSKLR